jgi:ubiquitin C-terminal hydrolase
LIHKGTIDFGHYYAYINPNLDDRWYEFDDLKQGVPEVSKNFAFKQGIGGLISEFKPIYQNSEF